MPSVNVNVVIGNASIKAKTKLFQFDETAFKSEKTIDEISMNPDVQKSEITICTDGINAPTEANKSVIVKASLRSSTERRISLSTPAIILSKSQFGNFGFGIESKRLWTVCFICTVGYTDEVEVLVRVWCGWRL